MQHVADSTRPSPFFNAGTDGVELHPRIKAAAPGAAVVTKSHADAFYRRRWTERFRRSESRTCWSAESMTQNCVTHTAISKAAEKYRVAILPDCCTTVSEILHLIALNAVSTRLALTPAAEALGARAA